MQSKTTTTTSKNPQKTQKQNQTRPRKNFSQDQMKPKDQNNISRILKGSNRQSKHFTQQNQSLKSEWTLKQKHSKGWIDSLQALIRKNIPNLYT